MPQQSGGNERVNAHALRELTDDSGGRTELVRDGGDLGPATAGIADELSRQYSLGYSPAAEKDGRWHTIRVEVRNSNYRVRAQTRLHRDVVGLGPFARRGAISPGAMTR